MPCVEHHPFREISTKSSWHILSKCPHFLMPIWISMSSTNNWNGSYSKPSKKIQASDLIQFLQMRQALTLCVNALDQPTSHAFSIVDNDVILKAGNQDDLNAWPIPLFYTTQTIKYSGHNHANRSQPSNRMPTWFPSLMIISTRSFSSLEVFLAESICINH